MRSNLRRTIILTLLIILVMVAGCNHNIASEPKLPGKNTVQNREESQPQSTAPAIDPAKTAESETYFKQGLAFYEQYNYPEAVANYDKAIAANPANAKVYTAKGIALCFEGDYQGGMVLIQKTLDMNSGYVPAFYDMAMAYKLQNKYDQSLYWFEKTIQGDPQNTWSYYGIATIYADRGHTQQSLTYLKKAIELDPTVKEIAKQQDHFAAMRSMAEFRALVR